MKTILIIVVAAAVVLLGYMFLDNVKLSNPQVSPTPIASWREYKNDDFGLKIQYPSDWFYDDKCDPGEGLLVAFGLKPDMIVCYSDAPSGGPITLGVYPRDPQLSRNIQYTIDSLSEPQREEVVVAGKTAIKISGIIKPNEGPGPEAGLPMTVIFLNSGDYTYRFVYIPVDDKDYTDVLDEMLETLEID